GEDGHGRHGGGGDHPERDPLVADHALKRMHAAPAGRQVRRNGKSRRRLLHAPVRSLARTRRVYFVNVVLTAGPKKTQLNGFNFSITYPMSASPLVGRYTMSPPWRNTLWPLTPRAISSNCTVVRTPRVGLMTWSSALASRVAPPAWAITSSNVMFGTHRK